MSYESELAFLCETFRKCRIQVKTVSPNESVVRLLEDTFAPMFERVLPKDMPIGRIMGDLKPHTLYRSVDMFRLRYMYLLLPDTATPTLLLIGPYTHTAISGRQILEIGEKNGISPKSQRFLHEYYEGIPIIPENSLLFTMLDTFCEKIWHSAAYQVTDIDQEWPLSSAPVSELSENGEFDDVLVSMKRMETRYNYENKLMQAVSLGQIHKANQLLAGFSEQMFEKRTADPLRNVKNYAIITNTLLRKAAENGGVHPIHLDRVSSAFAVRIEQLSPAADSTELMREMFRTYCRLVRQHSLQNYSPTVQKTMLLIDADLSAGLSLRSLAEEQNISPGYLSTIFKKETGKTVTEYIREKRIKHAAHLLTTTHLQIQTVALHCGIIDVQYFSKIFKKETGKTPKEYRDAAKQPSF